MARARPRPAGRRAPPAERLARSGPGALAGAGYPLDRETTAAELGFDGVTANSLDAVGDRDFVVETLAAAVALGMVHLSRLAEEITWWSNPRFGFVRVADAYSTGSSMMPNKRNPDPAELVRGRTAARDRARSTAMLGAAQGPAARLPARPPGGQAAAVRRGRDATRRRSRVMAGLVATLAVDRGADARAAAEDGLHDGDDARRRASSGAACPFRAAHHIVGGARRRGPRREA